MTDLTPEKRAEWRKDADLIEKAAQAMFERGERERITWGALDLDLDTYRVLARSALDSVASALRAEGAATALRDAEQAMPEIRDMPPRMSPILRVRAWLRDRADQIEKENHR